MRVPVWVFGVSIWILLANGGLAWSQATNQPGTLQKPLGLLQDDAAATPSSTGSSRPGQKAGSAKSDKTPVIQPHGQVHPHKPANNVGKLGPTALPSANAPPDTATSSPAALATKLGDPEKPDGAVGKLPRFASLRFDDVNMRAGPGTRYRIEWVYRRRDLPVEIEREFDVWRWVRDPDGVQGWVHQATLMGRRNFIVQKTEATLRSEAADSSAPVAVLKVGVIGRIRSCEATSDWCNVQSGSYRGYLRRAQLWGVLPGETINQ